jgi:hypothetical protein
MNQHYLPISYLKQFCDPDCPANQEPYVWVNDLKSADWRKRAPKNIAYGADIYSAKNSSGVPDHSLEQTISKIESDVAILVRDIGTNPGMSLSDESKRLLTFFVVLMSARVPVQMKHDLEPHNDLVKMILSLRLQLFEQDPESFDAALEQYERDSGIEMPAATLKDFKDRLPHLQLNKTYAFVDFLRHAARWKTEALLKMGCSILVSDYYEFLTSDMPVGATAIGFEDSLLKPGWAYEKTEVTFPLTRNIGLLWTWQNEGKFATNSVGQRGVRTMNLRTANYAQNLLIAARPDVCGSQSIAALLSIRSAALS